MSLSNLSGWNNEAAPAAACGTACGAGDKPAEKPAACGSACGAGDKWAGFQSTCDCPVVCEITGCRTAKDSRVRLT